MGKSKARRGKAPAKVQAASPSPPEYPDPHKVLRDQASTSTSHSSFASVGEVAACQLEQVTAFLEKVHQLHDGFGGGFSASMQLMEDMGKAKRDWLLAHPHMPLSVIAEEEIMLKYWDESRRLGEAYKATAMSQLTVSEGEKPRFFYMVTPSLDDSADTPIFKVKQLERFRYMLAKDELLASTITVIVGEEK